MTKLLLSLVAICAAALLVLALRPGLDLDVARTFYAGSHHFVGNTPLGTIVRYTVWYLPFVLYALMLLAWIFAQTGLWAARFAPSARNLLFLTFSLALGPGILVHAVFKETSHRPRPYSITQFGGPDAFRPFTRFDGACQRSCSFPSAETAAATWTLAPASLVPSPWRGLALGAAVLLSVGTGLLRMAFGGHFLSDVYGGALITILVVLLFRALLLSRTKPPA